MKKASLTLVLLAVLCFSAQALAQSCITQNGCLLASGVGKAPAQIRVPGQAAAMAERAAKTTAMKNLLACMKAQGFGPPGPADAKEATLPPWVKVASVAHLADGSVMVTLAFCP